MRRRGSRRGAVRARSHFGKGFSLYAKQPRTPMRINYHFVVWLHYRGYTFRTASMRLFTCSFS